MQSGGARGLELRTSGLHEYSPQQAFDIIMSLQRGASNLLQSLAPTLIKLTCLWFSNDLEDSD